MTTITLTTPSGPYPLLPVYLQGVDNSNPPASGMTYLFDGTTSGMVVQFSPASSTGGTWSGYGPRLPAPTTNETVPNLTIQVSNTATPTVVSNTATFALASLLPDTYIISTDQPSPTLPGVFTGAGENPQAVPPYLSGSFAPSYPAGTLSYAGSIPGGSQAFLQWHTHTTPTDIYSEFPSASIEYSSVGTQTANGSGFTGGVNNPFTSPLGVSNIFTSIYYPWYVNNLGVAYLGSTSVNGTLLQQGTCSGVLNQGTLGPGYWAQSGISGAAEGSQIGLSSATNSITASAPSYAGTSTAITLTGVDNSLVLMKGMDWNLDFQLTGSGVGTGLVYQRVSSFTPATSIGGTWSAVIGTLSAGAHVITVRDHDVPLKESTTSPTITILGNANLRVSQIVEQVWAQATPAKLRVSQIVEQVWVQQTPDARVGLYQTDVLPSSTDTYEEFSTSLSWSYATALLPDNQQQRNNAMILTTLDMGFIGNVPVVSVAFNDSTGTNLSTTPIVPTGTVPLWDAAVWDVATWDGQPLPLSPWWAQWQTPIVFKQGFLTASGISQPGFRIATAYLEYQVLGYVQQLQSGEN